jgi:sterol desaturase/sphingolipid hydroxylase (fatty acid hydroxylase superfamily)
MLSEAVIANKAWIGAGVFALLFALERMRAATPAPPNAARLLKNGALWGLLLILSPLIVLPLTAFAAGHPLWFRPADWPQAVALAADIVLLDLWSYWLHRAYHEVPLMRRFHRIHHLDERLDTTSAVRFHPGEVALSALLRMIPIIVLAIPFRDVVLFETLLLAESLFHHSNVRLPAPFERALSRIIVTPSIHWVHHHAIPADTNSNYAAVFSLWDRVFRTRSQNLRTAEMKIGIENAKDAPVLNLLLAPLHRGGL